MNPESFELTLEQQFHLRLVAQSIHGISREQAAELLLEASRLMMVKDNVIRNLLKKLIPRNILI